MNSNLKTYLILHLSLMVYSANGILSKLASQQSFLSLKFLLLYAAAIAALGVYALVWQQVLKRVPLSAAYANKALTVVWGCIWGLLIFDEHLSSGKIIGGLLVLAGIVLYGRADGKMGERDG